MNKLDVRVFDKLILDEATLIKNNRPGNYFITYNLNNGYYIKIVKAYEALQRELKDLSIGGSILSNYLLFIQELFDKLYRSKIKTLPSFVLPSSIYIGMTDRNANAYSIPAVDSSYICLKEFIKKIDFSTFVKIFLKLIEDVRNANYEGVFMPDLGNLSNIFINPKSLDLKFIDYDGMQIDQFHSFTVSGILQNDTLSIEDNPLFCDPCTGLYKTNINILSLFSLFLLYTTKRRLMNFQANDYRMENGKPVLRKEAISSYTQSIGIDGTLFEDELFRLLLEGKANFPDVAINELVKSHRLTKDPNNYFSYRKK